DRSYYSAIELSDLTAHQEPERVLLTLTNPASSSSSSTNPTSSSSTTAGGAADSEPSLSEGALGEKWQQREWQRRVKEEVADEWEGRLDRFRIEAAAVRGAMRDVTGNMREGAERSRKTGSSGGLPRAQLVPLTSLSTSTYEILRHFWTALLPPPPSLPLSHHPTPQSRAAKVEKFKTYLEKSLERIRLAEEEGRREGGDEGGRRVEAALGTVRGAVEAALGEYGRRMGSLGAGAGGGGASRSATPRPAPPPKKAAVAAGA
ncbi:hypothetical protein JCM11251_000498, partial [Rhodosporidiobolus azoricus]